MRELDMTVDLTQMKPNESGVIEELKGGQDFMRKIQNMGIRPGKKIIKVSSHFMRGPQTVKIGNMRVAIGFGMAKKIFVKVGK